MKISGVAFKTRACVHVDGRLGTHRQGEFAGRNSGDIATGSRSKLQILS